MKYFVYQFGYGSLDEHQTPAEVTAQFADEMDARGLKGYRFTLQFSTDDPQTGMIELDNIDEPEASELAEKLDYIAADILGIMI